MKLVRTAVLFGATCFSVWVASPASRADVSLGTGYSDDDMKVLTKFLGAGLMFHELNGPSQLGEIWGVDFGFSAAATFGGKMKDVVEDNGGDLDLPVIPYGYLVLRGGFPFGLSASFGYIPKIDISGFSLRAFGTSVAWSFGEFFEFPVTANVRFSTDHHTFGALVSGVASQQAKFKIHNYGLTSTAGYPLDWGLFKLEPYLGMGMLYTDANLAGAVTVLNTTQTLKNSAGAVQFHLQTGLDFTLFYYVQLAMQYSLVGSASQLMVHLGVTI